VRRFFLLLSVVGLILATACVEQEAEQAVTKSNLAANDTVTPRVPPRGKVTVSELATIFSKACLENIPDQKSAVSAIRGMGLQPSRVEPYPGFGHTYGDFIDPKRGLTASVSTIYVTDIGPGGSGVTLEDCRVTAEVSDPESDWLKLFQQLRVEGSEIEWSSKYPTSGSYRKDRQKFNLGITGPELVYRADLPEGVCGDLPDCIGWGSVEMMVTVDEKSEVLKRYARVYEQ
jgi:hypothetical protein